MVLLSYECSYFLKREQKGGIAFTINQKRKKYEK